MSITYSDYLKINELLSLQQPLSEGPEHDEMLFIVIHQVHELWFKEVLHELRLLQKSFAANDTPQALFTLKRVLTILKTLVTQVDILETMTPLSFSSFRARLESSSGFQSVQFRELEILLGNRQPGKWQQVELKKNETDSLSALIKTPTLYDGFLSYLKANSYTINGDVLQRDFSLPYIENKSIQAVLIDIYRNNPSIAQICERLVDLDEGFQEWRYRHVKMVERTIGTKMGTGGSLGVEYLKTTLFRPIFPDLWSIRKEF